MSRAIDGDKLFEYIQKEKAWKQFTIKRPRYDKGKQDAYYEMLEIIQEQPTLQLGSWIPVSERLPEKNKVVLMYALSRSRGGYVYTIGSCSNDCWFTESGVGLLSYPNGQNYDVLAWMPLPEPYKE